MGIGKFLGGLNQGLQQLTPEQRAMLLRTAAATTRSPMAAKGFTDQAQETVAMEASRQEARRKQALEQYKQAQINQRQNEKMRFDLWVEGEKAKRAEADRKIKAGNLAVSEQNLSIRQSELEHNKGKYNNELSEENAYERSMRDYLAAKTDEERARVISNSESSDFLSTMLKDSLSNKGAKMTDRSRRLADLKAMGIPVDRAVTLVDGYLDFDTDADRGLVTITDKLQGSAWQVPIDEFRQADVGGEIKVGEDYTLWDLAGDATGITNYTRRAFSYAAPYLGLPVEERVLRAQKLFQSESEGMISALAKNPRVPVSEQEIIRNILPSPGALKAPEVLRPELVAIGQQLRERLSQKEQMANDRSLSAKTREESAAVAEIIKSYLPRLGAPIPFDTAEEAESAGLPSGTKIWVNGRVGTIK